MSAISSWLLSVIGVIIIGVLINIVLPHSSISKFIYGIYSFIIIYVIITPIINILSDGKSFTINYDSIIDSSYIDSLNENKEIVMEKSIITKSASLGIKNIEVDIVSHISENNLILDKVYVNLQNAIIDENLVHIDKYQVLDEVVNSITKIGRENIVYYEWEKNINR